LAELKKIIGNAYKYLDIYSFRLPNFEVAWSIYLKEFKDKYYSKAFEACLNKQFMPAFIHKWNHVGGRLGED
jgi:hypothetical protein